MQQLILILHVLIAVCLLILILVQNGKGAGIGASFGSGASNTMFGSQGPLPFLVKLTGFLAAIFFITSLALGYFTAHQAKMQKSSGTNIINTMIQQQSSKNNK